MSAHNTRAKSNHAIRIKRFRRQFERYRRGERIRSYEVAGLCERTRRRPARIQPWQPQ